MASAEAFRYRQELREAERAQLYWQQQALEQDVDKYTTEEYARAIEPILKRRKELDRQEQEWKDVTDPLDFTPDADPRKLQDQKAVRMTRELNNPKPPQKFGIGKGEKFEGKKPAKSPVARKEAAAEMDLAMETSSEEESQEEGEEEESDEEPGEESGEEESGEEESGEEESDEEESDEKSGEEGEGGAARARRMDALSSNSDDNESTYSEGEPAARKRERRRARGLYDDEAGFEVDDEKMDERDEYLNAYEAFVVTRSMADTSALLDKLKKAVEFYVHQADRAVQSAEACEEATKAVVRAIEERDASEDDCEKVLVRVKKEAQTLRSTVAKALNDAYSTEELAADAQEVRAYAAQQMEESDDPYARAQEIAAQEKARMFQAVEILMQRNNVRFDIKKFVTIREGEEEGEE